MQLSDQSVFDALAKDSEDHAADAGNNDGIDATKRSGSPGYSQEIPIHYGQRRKSSEVYDF